MTRARDVADLINGNVGTSSITNDAVTLAKMASGTDGNLITYDTNGDPAYVTTGTAGQMLKSNGAGAAPAFVSGGRTLLQSQSASASSEIVFTTGFSSVYTRYQLEIDYLVPATDDTVLYMRFSDDGGATYESGASDYRYRYENNNSSSTTATSAIPLSFVNGTAEIGTGTIEQYDAKIEIMNFNDARYTSIFCNSVYISANDTFTSTLSWGKYVQAASAHNGIRLYMTDNAPTDTVRNIASGDFRLYGLT